MPQVNTNTDVTNLQQDEQSVAENKDTTQNYSALSFLVSCATGIYNLAPWKAIFFLGLVGTAPGVSANRNDFETQVLNDPKIQEICGKSEFGIFNRIPDSFYMGKGGVIDFPECLDKKSEACVKQLNQCVSTIRRETPPQVKISIFDKCEESVKKSCAQRTPKTCVKKRGENIKYTNSDDIIKKQMRIVEIRNAATAKFQKWQNDNQKKIDKIKSKLNPIQTQLFVKQIIALTETYTTKLLGESNDINGGQCGDHAKNALYQLLQHQKENDTNYQFDLVVVTANPSPADWDPTHNYLMINDPNPEMTYIGDEKSTAQHIQNRKGVTCDTWHRFFGVQEDDKSNYLSAESGWSSIAKIRIGLNPDGLPKEAVKFLCNAYSELNLPVKLPESCEVQSEKTFKSEL